MSQACCGQLLPPGGHSTGHSYRRRRRLNHLRAAPRFVSSICSRAVYLSTSFYVPVGVAVLERRRMDILIL